MDSDFQQPDFNAIASDLKSKGVTYQDIRDNGTSYLRSMANESLSNPEGARESEVPVGDVPSDGPESPAISKLLSAYESLEASEASPITPDAKPFPLEDQAGFTFEFEDFVMSPVRTEEKASEVATVMASQSSELSEALKSELMQGKEDIFESLWLEGEDLSRQETIAMAEEEIAEAEIEAVPEIIERTQRSLNRVPSFNDFKRDYVIQQVPDADPNRVDVQIAMAHDHARNLQIYQERLAENSTIWDSVKDLGEFIIPFAGTSEIAYASYLNDMDDVIDELDKLSPQEQTIRITEIANQWAEYETQLLGRNNSILNSMQIENLRLLMIEGGASIADGTYTAAERAQFTENLINFGFGGLGMTGTIKGVSQLAKSIFRKILPSKPVDPNTLTEKSMLDVLYGEDWQQSLKVPEADKKAEAVKHGLSPEDAAFRHILNPDNDGANWQNITKTVTNLNENILIDNTLSNMGMQRARVLETQTGSSLNVIDGKTVFKSNTKEGSLGDFEFTLGDGNRGGFKTEKEARAAMKNNILPSNARVVQIGGEGPVPPVPKKVRKGGKKVPKKGVPSWVKKSGEDDSSQGTWFIQADITHEFSPRMDVAGWGSGSNTNRGGLAGAFLNPLRILGGDVLKGVFALKNKGRAFGDQFQKQVEDAFSGMDSDISDFVGKALVKGDENQIVYTQYRDFADAVGEGSMEQLAKAFDNYKKIRIVMDDIYHLRNKAFYTKKRDLGYNTVSLGDDIEDLGRRIEIKDLEGTEIWDVAAKRFRPAKEDDILMKLDRGIEVESQGRWTQVAVPASNVSPLKRNLLSYRTGHIDRMYRDAGWVVKQPVTVKIDGKDVEQLKPTHIVKSYDEAKKVEASILEKNPKAEVNLTRSRENDELDEIMGDPESVQFSYGASHFKERGEMLKGSDGLNAPTVDVFSSIEASVRQAERLYDINMLESLKSRFFNQFENILKKGKATTFSPRFDDMVAIGRDAPESVKAQAKAAKHAHNYIQAIGTFQRGRFYQGMDNIFRSLEGKGIGPFKLPALDSQGLAGTVLRGVAKVIIEGRPIFQTVQNLTQGLYIALRNPVGGAKALPQLTAIMPNLLGKSDNYFIAAKALGVSEATAKQVVRDMLDSGMLHGVGRADDFLAMTNEGFRAGASTIGKVANAPFAASRSLQETSIKTVNALAYLSEFNVAMSRKMPYNAKTKATISYNAQRLTATQNSIDKFVYQQEGNPLAFAFQFIQHMHKIFLDVIADPSVKLFTGKNIGKEAGVFSETRAQAATTLILTAMMFGPDGLLGENLGSKFADQLARVAPNLAKTEIGQEWLTGGAYNTGFNAFVEYATGLEGGKIDASAGVGPAAILDIVSDFMLANPGSMDMFGATASVGADVWGKLGWGGSAWAIAFHEEMDTADKVSNFLWDVGGIVKGVSDFDKAIIAYQLETMPYTSTLSSELRVTQKEAFGAALNFRSTLSNDYFNRQDFQSVRRSKDYTERMSETMLRGMSRELAQLKDEGKLDYTTSVQTHAKWVSYAKNLTDWSQHDEVEDIFRIKAMNSNTPTYDAYIRPYREKPDLKDRVRELNILLMKAETEEAKQEIEAAIEVYTLLDGAVLEVYEESK